MMQDGHNGTPVALRQAKELELEPMMATVLGSWMLSSSTESVDLLYCRCFSATC
jgi:hypothetical protein